MKYLKFIIYICICLFLTGCSYKYVSLDITKDNSIIIEKININEKYTIDSIDNFVNGIVMFKENGRPDKENSNTVIGAHSGYGKNAYFNDLNKLEKDDIIKIIYNNAEYKYIVIDKKIVDETDLSVLEDSNDNILTLLTCKIGNNTKRIIVISKLIH